MTRTGKIDSEKVGATAKPRSRNAALVLALCVIAGVGVWLLVRRSDNNPHQPVTKLEQTNTVALIREGVVYVAQSGDIIAGNRSRVGKVTAIPASGSGQKRTLALPPTPVSFPERGDVPADDRGLLVLDAKPPTDKEPERILASLPPAAQNLRNLGTFALPAAPASPPGKKFVFTAELSPKGRRFFPTVFPALRPGGSVSVWRVPYSGEAATKTTLDTQNLFPVDVFVAPAAQGVYWRRPRPLENALFVVDKGYYSAFPPSSDLMFSPLDGTQPHVAATGLYNDVRANPQVVCWKVPGVYPDTSQTLHILRFADGANAKESVIKDFKEMEYWGILTLTDFGGRWYWIENDEGEGAGPSRGGPPRRTRVVSQKFDGTDYQVIVAGQDAQGADRRCDALQVAGDKLYVIYEGQGAGAARNADGIVTDAGRRRYTARIHPDRADALGTPIEAIGTLDSGYCYFEEFRKEPGFRQTFDFLFPYADSGPDVKMLSRLPLLE